MASPLIGSSPDTAQHEELRHSFGENGYLLVRGLLCERQVTNASAELVELLRSAGIDPGEPGMHDPYRDRALFTSLFRCERLHALGRDRALVDLVAALIDDEAPFVHPGPALRIVPPSHDDSDVTSPHQDFVNMQGSPRAVVAWLPLLPSPVESGPIELLAGSHRSGPLPVLGVRSGRVLTSSLESADLNWSRSELNPGDAVLFSALTVHRARANRSSRLRLSVDFRYQARDEPICATSLRPPTELDWQELSATWSDRALAESLVVAPPVVAAYDPRLAQFANTSSEVADSQRTMP